MASLKEQKALSILLILIIVLAAAIVAAGAVIIYFWLIPGEIITREWEYSDFTAVDVSSAFKVVIIQDNSYRVIISADEKIFDEINVTKTGSTLIVRTEPNTITASDVIATIKMPNLNRIVLSGASSGAIQGFSSSEPFTVQLSGASNLKIQDINVGDIDVELSGASSLIAEGSGNDLISIISGASNLDFTNFPVTNSDLFISGASQATVKLDGTLDAVASGASTLYYIGEPTLGDIQISDSSTVNKK